MITRSDGPDSHMIGLGEVMARQVNGQVVVYTASAMGGGVLVRSTATNLSTMDVESYGTALGFSAAHGLQATVIDGTPVLLSPGRFGTQIDAWTIAANGALDAARPLTLVGGRADAITALVDAQIGSSQVFVTASRFGAGLETWVRDGDILRATGQGPMTGFLPGNAVRDLAIAWPGGRPHVLAISSTEDDLMAFPLGADGALGIPSRLDLRDGLFVDTPTELRVVELGGRSYAILGSAGSDSLSVVAIGADGRMQVTDQVNDTRETFFGGLAALETLDVGGRILVLAAGGDNGLTLMTLEADGTLLHVASLGDEMRTMAMVDPGGLEMIWRDGGLDIFVTGQVIGDTVAGRGVSQLRVDNLLADLPVRNVADGSLEQRGTDGVDVFVVLDSDERQTIYDFEPGVDRLDLSNFAWFYDIDDIGIRASWRGSYFWVDDAQLRIYTTDSTMLTASDFSITTVKDLWRIDTTPLPDVPQQPSASTESDFLDGRAGNDMLLGQPADAGFDPYSAQVFRLYQATLDRAPDAKGLMNWTTTLADGERTLVQVASGFTNSAEFRKIYGATDNEAFVTLLYDNVLGRAPDAIGLANWVARLDGGMSRAQAVTGFSESAEFRARTAAEALTVSKAAIQADWADDVYRLYRATLDRDPDLNGYLNWSQRLADGMPFLTVVSGFTNSPEFRQTYGATDNRAFVTLLYDNVLDRAPDSQGLINWTARLASGEMTRAQVVQGFAQSTEFRIGTSADHRDWVRSKGPDDILDGAGGDNTLMGGMLSDTFVFRAADKGRHTVVDAEPWDVLSLHGFGYASVTDVAAHLRVDGTDVIFADEGVSINFLNTTLPQVIDMGFAFHG